MMFRDSHQTTFQTMPVSGEAVKLDRERDLNTKHSREENINASKDRVSSDFKKEDNVLFRNFEKSSTQSFNQNHAYKNRSSSNEGHFLLVERETDGKIFRRHPDDVKKINGTRNGKTKIGPSEEEFIQMWHRLAEESHTDDTNDDDNEQHVHRRNEEFHVPIDEQHCTAIGSQKQEIIRRPSGRIRRPNPRYYNDSFVKSF